MTVRIGSIELLGLQDIRTEDARSLVPQRGPGQAGSVFQDLGREPIRVVLEGVLLGDETQEALEELRQAQQRAEPLSFAADVISGAELTDVLISELELRQLAGHRDRYAFFMRVEEYTEPPEPPGASLAAVDAGIGADAAEFAQGGLDAAGVLQDPGSLMDAVGANPGLLDHLSAGELGGVLGEIGDSLSAGDFGGLMNAIGELDIQKIGDLINELKDVGSLGEFIEKFADEGLNLLEELTGIDLSEIQDVLELVQAVASSGDFLAKLQRVGDEGAALVDAVSGFDPFAGLRELVEGGGL